MKRGLAPPVRPRGISHEAARLDRIRVMRSRKWVDPTIATPEQPRKIAGQAPFVAGSSTATHSTWWVTGKRSKARTRRGV
ncbi:hypothetical protein Shyhy02_21160 [Streptomyces hygroscopicus subsp. hygroscopicus]|nr:hypothetical protein Shyhy02_21160 [Streptomyces hygroscopicus subsp. hygroscopicus]